MLPNLPPSELHKKGMSPFSLHRMACCGTREIYSTPYTEEYSKDKLLEWLEWKFIGDGDGEWILTGAKVRGGILLLTLNDYETYKRNWALSVGFKELQKFTNHIHGSKLILFSYQLPEDLEKWKWIPKMNEEKERKGKVVS